MIFFQQPLNDRIIIGQKATESGQWVHLWDSAALLRSTSGADAASAFRSVLHDPYRHMYTFIWQARTSGAGIRLFLFNSLFFFICTSAVCAVSRRCANPEQLEPSSPQKMTFSTVGTHSSTAGSRCYWHHTPHHRQPQQQQQHYRTGLFLFT